MSDPLFDVIRVIKTTQKSGDLWEHFFEHSPYSFHLVKVHCLTTKNKTSMYSWILYY